MKTVASYLRRIAVGIDPVDPPDLIFTIGIPGSGKSTWIHSQPGYVVVSPDGIRGEMGDITDQSRNAEVWATAKVRVAEALKQGRNVILDSTNVEARRRREFVEGLPSHILKAKLFHVDPETAKQRIRDDLEKKVPRSNVPDYVVDRMYQNFKDTIDERQLESEGFEVL